MDMQDGQGGFCLRPVCHPLFLMLFFVFGFFAVCACAQENESHRALDRWLDQQSAIRTLSASFEEIRSLKGLKEPLRSYGKMWYQAPGKFRWQLGEPPRSILLRDGERVQWVDMKKMRMRDVSKGMGEGGIGFVPVLLGREEFYRRFEVASIKKEGKNYQVEARPTSKRLSAGMERLVFAFGEGKEDLNFFEIWFRDGSMVRNAFSNIVRDKPIPESVFRIDLKEFHHETQP